MQWHPGTVAEEDQDGSNRVNVVFDLGFSSGGVFGPAFFEAAPMGAAGGSYAYKWLDLGAADVSEGSEASQDDADVKDQPLSGVEGADLQGEPVTGPASPAGDSGGAQGPAVVSSPAGNAGSGAPQPVKRYSQLGHLQESLPFCSHPEA